MSNKKTKPRLSKGILEMKFMQRTKAKVVKDLEDQQGRDMYSNEITTRMKQDGSVFITEPSFARCEDLIEGRLSFKGMNPEIERLLELEMEERDAALRPEPQKKEVEDDEMVDFYAANSTMQKKFNKHQPNSKKRIHEQNNRDDVRGRGRGRGQFGKNKRRKFMKPTDDE